MTRSLRHDPAGCLNCGTGLPGQCCHACGQDAHGGHRSLRHLAHEFVEIGIHADSRPWRTLLLLASSCRPKASQIPPLRWFFVVLSGVGASRAPVHLPASEIGRPSRSAK
nr:hypothetical protein [uncultured Lichenicoccus sp.]